MWGLPFTVEINGVEHNIRNRCDYRLVLDCMMVFEDDELNASERVMCALCLFYEDVKKITDFDSAVKEMFKIINCGAKGERKQAKNDGGAFGDTPLMDWKHDWDLIAPAVSHYLGYEIRDPSKFTHWFTFMGAYRELKDCTFTTVTTIRSKRRKGVKLEAHEQSFLNANPALINIPTKLSAEDLFLLENDW